MRKILLLLAMLAGSCNPAFAQNAQNWCSNDSTFPCALSDVQISRLTTDFAKVNTSLATVTNFSPTINLLAGKTYIFEINLDFIPSSASGTQTTLAGGTVTATSIQGSTLRSDIGGSLASPNLTALSTVQCNNTGVTFQNCYTRGSIVVNAAGTFIPQFALSTGTTSSSVKAGSWIRVMRVGP